MTRVYITELQTPCPWLNCQNGYREQHKEGKLREVADQLTYYYYLFQGASKLMSVLINSLEIMAYFNNNSLSVFYIRIFIICIITMPEINCH